MKTLSFIILQISSVKTDINSFLSNYAVPVIAMCLVIGVCVGVVMNFDKIVDRDGQGTRKEGLINLLWIVGYVVVGLVVIGAVIALINSKLRLSV